MSSNRQTFPLSLLLVIVTGCAVLAAILAPLVRNFRWDVWLDHLWELLFAIAVCIVVGSQIGIFVGLHQFRRILGALSGAALGAGIGLLAGLLMTIDQQSLSSVLQATTIGCVLLVVTAWLVRPPLKSDEPDEEVIDAVEAEDT